MKTYMLGMERGGAGARAAVLSVGGRICGPDTSVPSNCSGRSISTTRAKPLETLA